MIALLNFKLIEHRNLIAGPAARWNLEPALVAAIVQQESGGNPYAWNPEPRYRWFWDVRNSKPFRTVTAGEMANKMPPVDFPALAGDPDQEWWGQQASWGLMQPMGAVAREHGFAEPYLPALVDVAANLDIGCRHLAKLQSRFTGGAVSAYNAGQPKPGSEYEQSVFAHRAALRPLFA